MGADFVYDGANDGSLNTLEIRTQTVVGKVTANAKERRNFPNYISTEPDNEVLKPGEPRRDGNMLMAEYGDVVYAFLKIKQRSHDALGGMATKPILQKRQVGVGPESLRISAFIKTTAEEDHIFGRGLATCSKFYKSSREAGVDVKIVMPRINDRSDVLTDVGSKDCKRNVPPQPVPSASLG
jgi:hypothetical protein